MDDDFDYVSPPPRSRARQRVLTHGVRLVLDLFQGLQGGALSTMYPPDPP
jgi:hypothetical protein